MRICLFYPRGKAHSGRPDVGHLASVLPPLGLASIAAVAERAGHDVCILDGALQPGITNAQWAQRICAFHPDVVGISSITAAFYDALDVCEIIKSHDPDIRIVFGGVHPSWGKERLLCSFDAIDTIIAGEGEYAFLRLINNDPVLTIPGCFGRDGSSIVSGPDQTREHLCAMDDLPFPAYHLLDGFPKQYRMPLFSYRSHPGAHIISSRGCVYRCTYCDRSVFHQSFRFNSPEYTSELVRFLATDYGIRHITFYDDLFTLNKNRVAQLCRKLRELPVPVRFNCIVRIGHIDDELIALLKQGGCWMVHVGIESGDQQILDKHKERLALARIREEVEKIHRAGIYVKGLFMMGFPGEREASIDKTIDLALSLPLKDANMTYFTPFPGAPISASIDSLGTFDNEWRAMDCQHPVFVPREIGSRAVLEKKYATFYERFYKRPFMRKIYRKMLFESPHSYYRLLRHLPHFLNFTRSLKRP